MAIVLEESTKQDIKKWSHDLLVSSRCIDTFPTPADKLAAFINLKVSPQDLSIVTPIYKIEIPLFLKNCLVNCEGFLFERLE